MIKLLSAAEFTFLDRSFNINNVSNFTASTFFLLFFLQNKKLFRILLIYDLVCCAFSLSLISFSIDFSTRRMSNFVRWYLVVGMNVVLLRYSQLFFMFIVMRFFAFIFFPSFRPFSSVLMIPKNFFCNLKSNILVRLMLNRIQYNNNIYLQYYLCINNQAVADEHV